MPRASRREHIITTAIALFSQYGYHGTGVDRIMEAAGVSKKTMYAYFRSKDELILAVLRHYDSLFRNNFMKQVEAASPDPKARLLAMFDIAGHWFMEDCFYGCMFINVIGEYSDKDAPLRQITMQFKRMMRDYIRDLCLAANAAEPEILADSLALLLEGAIVTAQVSQKPEAAHIAKRAAKVLIGQHT